MRTFFAPLKPAPLLVLSLFFEVRFFGTHSPFCVPVELTPLLIFSTFFPTIRPSDHFKYWTDFFAYHLNSDQLLVSTGNFRLSGNFMLIDAHLLNIEHCYL
ncbi:hypothetical protein D6T17_26055 [Salmonella enterica subsp. enterica serovar Oranienburg]|nr:hypothetical protein [Salmonella enterica]EBS4087392.1 hypothetical protein [Salmonella enterica subsp. enterica serovar Newport]EBS4407906.1 hypothetical protein [Salmonella enterica subsp. enterica serovar Newport]EBV1275613.1 hypothetical protein [Salmonella enterica subsp. enterica serovar Oranienburg]EBY8947698.1 hypothetical protein [Salmonella enterica subsp. enterica serovar Oranienburg]